MLIASLKKKNWPSLNKLKALYQSSHYVGQVIVLAYRASEHHLDTQTKPKIIPQDKSEIFHHKITIYNGKTDFYAFFKKLEMMSVASVGLGSKTPLGKPHLGEFIS